MYYAAKLLIKDPKVYVADYGAAYFWENIFMDADETLLAQKITVIFKNHNYTLQPNYRKFCKNELTNTLFRKYRKNFIKSKFCSIQTKFANYETEFFNFRILIIMRKKVKNVSFVDEFNFGSSCVIL